MKTITKTTDIYEFDELSEKAKERARDWWREGGLDYEWRDCIYEDAERIGLKITEFDLARSRHAKGDLLKSPTEICSLILSEHGKTCDTYKLAMEFFKDKHEGKSVDVEEFTRALLEEYSVMLQKESEYLQSDECADESIRINEYTFTVDGKREG